VKVVCPSDEVTRESGLLDIEERFIREGELLESLDHPHILPVYANGAERGYLYHVMEYVPNGSLADAIHGRAAKTLPLPLSPSETLEITRQVGSALQYIHERGIVHRDVKPGNLLVRGDILGERSLLLADFGVARRVATSSGMGSDDQVTGTVAYMAPEEFSGTFSPASDQYSLAVMTYQLLSGHLPFEGTVDEQIAGHLETVAPSIRLYAEAVPWQIEEVLARALEKHPEDRYPSVAAFVAALDQALREAESGAGDETEETLAALALVRATTRSTPAALRRRGIAGIAGIAGGRGALRPRFSSRQRTLVTLTAAAVLLLGTLLAVVALPGGPNTPAPIANRGHATRTSAPGVSVTVTVNTTPTTQPTLTPPTPTTAPANTGTDSASLVAISAPSSVPAGHLFSFSVTLANTGTSTWAGSNGYQLTCDTERHPVQDCPSGFAANLGNYAVAPGSDVTFRITLTALSSPGIFLAWMNMAHSSAPFASNDVLVRVATLAAIQSSPPPQPTATPRSSPTPTPPPASPTPPPTDPPSPSPTPTTPPTPSPSPSPSPTPSPSPPSPSPPSPSHHHHHPHNHHNLHENPGIF
jgi:tRNA A-37 threonylcarbamoyl transferase component Bud32